MLLNKTFDETLELLLVEEKGTVPKKLVKAGALRLRHQTGCIFCNVVTPEIAVLKHFVAVSGFKAKFWFYLQ